jgi:4-alpha-glucanotransferase
MRRRRKSGILLHPTSLPGPGGIGAMGKEARRFVDFLAGTGQSLWQVLPLGPVAYGNSPYSCYSAFAGNPLLIDLEAIVAEGDLSPEDASIKLPDDWVDYPRVEKFKLSALRRAAANFFSKGYNHRRDEFHHFCDNTFWLNDFALFMSLKDLHGGKSWLYWPKGVVSREPAELMQAGENLGVAVGEYKYMQWQFARQWLSLKRYANQRGIEIIGDIPIFVAFDSADVWANPQLFHLDEKGRPTVVAGVPPDYFSKTGQLWGNPLYNWEANANQGYSWWVERMRNDLKLYDIVRLDHFRGFEAYWEVPAKEKTAEKGRWVKGPGADLFNALVDRLGPLPIIAEDLGIITPDVDALRERFAFPGMKILQFAFGSGPDNPYLPHNHERECVVYTGTHDNDTTLGWFLSLPRKERKRVLRYLSSDGRDIAADMIRSALSSVADMAVIPMQDILRLDSSARMNIPGTSANNWTWRFSCDLLREEYKENLLEMTELYGRSNRKEI